MLIMTERIPSAEELFEDLTAFAYANDPEFCHGQSDATETGGRITKKVAGYINDVDVPEKSAPIYDEKQITFSAEREPATKHSRTIDSPAGFVIRQVLIEQIAKVPPQLIPFADIDMTDEPEEDVVKKKTDEKPKPESEDLVYNGYNIKQTLTHTVKKEENFIVFEQAVSYAIRHLDEVLYEASPETGPPVPTYVPVPHHPEPLRLFTHIEVEAAPDPIQQLPYNDTFEKITYDAPVDIIDEQHLEQLRASAILSITGLMAYLKKPTDGKEKNRDKHAQPLPDQLLFIDAPIPKREQ